MMTPDLESAPLAYVRLGDDGFVQAANMAARQLGVAPGMRLGSLLSPAGADPAQLLLDTGGSQRRVRIVKTENAGIWIEDLSEITALSRQLQKHRSRLNRGLGLVEQQATNALGYAELLSVILEEGQVVAPERWGILKSYQSKIVKALQTIREAVAEGPARSRPAKGGEVLVVDAHRDLAELVAELLKTRGYRAISFTEPADALQYARMNAASLGVALVDGAMTIEGTSLAEALGQLDHGLVVAELALDDPETPGGGRRLIKPIDFDELFTLVGKLMGA